MYDVIVVGARVAGAPTAMLLARRGLKVLAVDRAGFPSDTLSTHQVQVPGGARLARWGVLEGVRAAGTPATRRVRFDPGPVVLEGQWPVVDGVDALYSPRRTILDKLLVDAAREAGAEVRERFAVEGIVFDDGRVVGIRGRERGGGEVRERARLVVGADGRHSLVAKAVRAVAYDAKPALSIAYYTYWAGVPMRGGEMYSRERRMIGAWPTNDGLVMTYVAAPASEFRAFRSDLIRHAIKDPRRGRSGSRGGCPPRLPQNRTYAGRIRLFGTAGYDPRRRPIRDLEVIPIAPVVAGRGRRCAGACPRASRPGPPDRVL